METKLSILTPKKRGRKRARIIKGRVTGWPVLTAGPAAAKLTHKQVQEILAEFPQSFCWKRCFGFRQWRVASV